MSTSLPTLDTPAAPEQQPRSRWPRYAAIAALVAAVVVGGWLMVVWWLLGDDAALVDPVVDDEGVVTDPADVEPPDDSPTGEDTAIDEGAAGLPDAVVATVERIEQALAAEDWEALAAVALEGESPFTATFGEELTAVEDLAAYWRGVATEEDLPGTVGALLASPRWAQTVGSDADGEPVTIHVTPRFMHEPTPEARAELEDALGAEWLDAQLADGQYLGWRLGITADGDWRFLVQGD